MPSVLIFLGAGASKAFANIPTMKEMVTIFEEQLRGQDALHALYKDTRAPLSEVYGQQLDLEALLSVLNGISKGRTFKDLGFYPTYLAKTQSLDPMKVPDEKLKVSAEKLRKFIESSINSYCEIKPSVKTKLFGLYSKLSEILPATDKRQKTYSGTNFWESNQWAIYTTNYDLSIETVCRDVGITINNGAQYDPTHDLRTVRPELLVGDSFKIVKLHGSISWYMRNDGIIAEYSGKPSEWDAVQVEEQIMLYPVEEKAMYEEPYIVLLNNFRQDLRRTQKWLFIGYSFNDPFLLRMMEYCSDDSKRIIVIHPKSDTLVKNQLSKFRGKLRTSQKKFGDETLWGELSNWLGES